jgi:hypothetical protein
MTRPQAEKNRPNARFLFCSGENAPRSQQTVRLYTSPRRFMQHGELGAHLADGVEVDFGRDDRGAVGAQARILPHGSTIIERP